MLIKEVTGVGGGGGRRASMVKGLDILIESLAIAV